MFLEFVNMNILIYNVNEKKKQFTGEALKINTKIYVLERPSRVSTYKGTA